MTSISWTNTASGNWNTAGNWSTGTVPGASDDVTINTSAVLTVTYASGTDSVLSLYLGGNDTFAMTGGKFTVLGNSTLYGNVTESAGTMSFAGAHTYFGSNFSQTGGTLTSTAGTIQFAGPTTSLAGKVTATALSFTSGTDTITASAVLAVDTLMLNSANLIVAQNLTQAGGYQQNGGTLTMGTSTVTLNGATTLNNADFQGSGSTLKLAGATDITYAYFLGAETVVNSGSIDLTSTFDVGYYGSDSVSFTNTATGSFLLDGDVTVSGNSGATVTNLGNIEKTGGQGTASINDNLISSGTLAVDSGTANLAGAANTLSGVVSGAGVLALNGTTTLSSGVSLTVATVVEGGNVTLGGNLSYAGTFEQVGGTLSVANHALTLGAPASLEQGVVTGTGTLNFAGGELRSELLTGTNVVNNSGTVSQTGYAYVGYNGSDTVTFNNLAGATYQLLGTQGLYGVSGSKFVNAGTFKTIGSGASFVNAPFSSTGTVQINGGSLAFNSASVTLGGTVSGSGTLALNSTLDTLSNKVSLTTAAVSLTGGTLTTGGALTYAGIFSQTAGTLALGKFNMKLTGPVNLVGGVSSGSATLTLANSAVSSYQFGGTGMVVNTGTLTMSSYIYVGTSASDTAGFNNSTAKSVFNIVNDNTVYGYANDLFSNAGTLEKTGGTGTSAINVSLNSTGTVLVNTGALRLDGTTSSLSGKLLGTGTLELNAGTVTVASGTTLTVANLTLDGSAVNFLGNTTYAGYYQQSTGTLSIGATTLALSGGESLSGGTLTGASGGKVTLSAPGVIGNYAFTGTDTVTNTSSLTAFSNFYVGYGSGDAVQMTNAAGATLTLETGASIYSTVNSSLTNAGQFTKSGTGTDYLYSTNFTNAAGGTLTVASGALALQGGTTTLNGTIGGAGLLAFTGGAATIAGTTALNVAALQITAGTVTTLAAQSYAGQFSETGGTLAIGNTKLALSGPVTLQGGTLTGTGGTITLSGTTLENGSNTLAGTLTVANTGTFTDTINLYVGGNTTDNVTLNNTATGTLLLGSNLTLISTGTTQITNAGLIDKAYGSGLAQIAPAVVNTGTINVGQGTLTFMGSVSGNGSITMGTNTVLAFNAAATGGTVVMGADADLKLNAAGFADTISGFAVGDVIDVSTLGYSPTDTFSYTAASHNLTVTQGSNTVTLHLAGSYNAGSFALFNDGNVVGITHT